ncbi:MAG: aldolase/citrate lyase family protein [Chitinophagaceae bacterium]|nr:aldolase/citrate lyase family protein [Chitinophagaceae bacterium]
MKKNQLKNILKNGSVAYGVISPTTDPVVCEYTGFSQLDFYIMDGEHGALTIRDVLHMVRACEIAGITPLARIPSLDEKMILQFFDAGIMGVMMPGTNSAEDCKQLVEFIKYPPLGKRGLGPVRSAEYMLGPMTQAEYIEFSNQETLIFPMIETPEAISQLESMCKVEGVDGFIIGPRDLALSMGYTDGPNHQEVKEAISHSIQTIRRHGKFIGTVAYTAEQVKSLAEQGVQIMINSISGLLTAGIKSFKP